MSKIVYLTGASGAIGRALAESYLEKGFRVVGQYFHNSDALAELKCDELSLVSADFENSADVRKFYAAAADIGIPDILVNNAGIYLAAAKLEEYTEEDFDRSISVNLKAALFLSQLALEDMKESGGRIINISSIGVKYGGSLNSPGYTLSKAALEALTLTLSRAGAEYNILANTIRLGVVETPLHAENPQKNMQARMALIPLSRAAELSEVVSAVMFLSSESASYITGTVLTVAGGE